MSQGQEKGTSPSPAFAAGAFVSTTQAGRAAFVPPSTDATDWTRCTSFPVEKEPLNDGEGKEGDEGTSDRAQKVEEHTEEANEPSRRARAQDFFLSGESSSDRSSSSEESEKEVVDVVRSDEESRRSGSSKRKKTMEKKKKKRHTSKKGAHTRERHKRKRTDKEKGVLLERLYTKDDRRVPGSHWWNVAQGEVLYHDLSGDRNNLVFETLYRLDVPNYRPVKVGLAASWVDSRKWRPPHTSQPVDVLFDRDAVSASSPGEHLLRYCTPEQGARLSDKRFRTINIAKQKRLEPVFDGRWFVPLLDTNVDVEGEKQENSGGETLEEQLLRRTREFNERTRLTPDDPRVWLEFAAFQDEFMRLGKKRASTAFMEKKASILEKALTILPDNEEIILLHLQTMAKLKDAKEAVALWERTLQARPLSGYLWNEFLTFRHSLFSSFIVSDARRLHGNAIQKMNVHRMKLGRNQEDVHYVRQVEMTLLSLFLRACDLERHAGYTERVVAAFQALIELNLFAPPDLGGWGQHMRTLEEFWDSEVPRFGEEGCCGFHTWLTGGDSLKRDEMVASPEPPPLPELPPLPSSPPPPPSPLPEDEDDERENAVESHHEDGGDLDEAENLVDEGIPDDVAAFGLWARREATTDRDQLKPVRTSVDQDAAENEPERVVFFDDIRDYLFKCTELHLEVVMAFLRFLRAVPACEVLCSSMHPLSRAGMVWDEDTANMMRSVGDTSVTEGDPRTRVSLARGVYKRALPLFPTSNVLLSSYLRFEFGQNAVTGRDVAKSTLGIHNTNIPLFHTYAQLEAAAGNVGEARRVYEAALSMYPRLPIEAQIHVYTLYRAYSEMEWDTGNPSNTLLIVLAATETSASVAAPIVKPKKKGAAVSPTRLLKARNVYKNRWAALSERLGASQSAPSSIGMDSVQPEAARDFLMCYAIFEHLTVGFDAACAILEAGLVALRHHFGAPSLEFERFGEDYAQFIRRYITRHPSPPRILRTVLERFLDVFPTNRVLLGLYVENESKGRMLGRLRRFFDNLCSRRDIQDCGGRLVPWIVSVHAEWNMETSYNRIRTILERSVDSKGCPHEPLLWSLYLHWEAARGPKGRGRRLLYRAIGRCPWSKQLFLDGLALLGNQLTLTECADLAELMQEKELRLHKLPGD